MTIRLSRRAQADLDDIRDYTLGVWGRAQWITYYQGLVAAFEHVTSDPTAGRSRHLLGTGLRSFTYREHLIFFAPIQAADGHIVILRILHQRRYLPGLSYYDDLDSG